MPPKSQSPDLSVQRRINATLVVVILAIIFLIARSSARAAQQYTWTGATSTNFETSSNWSPSAPAGPPANSTTSDTALFTGSPTANQPSLTISRSIKGLIYQSGGWTLTSGAFVLTLGTGGIDASGQTSGTNAFGNLAISNDQTWTTGSSGSVLQFDGTVNLNGTSNASRTLTVAGAGNATFNSTIQNTFAGSTGNLTWTGTGTLTLNGTNTYNGVTTLSSGTVSIGNNSAFGTSSISLGNTTLQAVTADRSISNNVTYTASTAAIISGSQNLTVSGTWTDTASRTLTNNIASGKIFTLSGNVFLSDNNTTTSRALTINGTGDTTISGVIANNNAGNSVAASLVKSGTGTLTLSSATGNTYTGTTSIASGTLRVTNTSGSATGSGAVNFTNGAGTSAILASGAGTTGIITGLVTTANTSSTISPGGAGTVGALTLSGGLNAASGALFVYDLGAATTPGTTSDFLNISGGTFTGSGTAGNLQFFFNGLAGVQTNTPYDLIHFANSAGLDVSDFSIADPWAFNGTFSIVGNDVFVTFTAVPEPSTWIGGALALAAIGFTQRRRLRARLARVRS
jgi:autotransporter-associated beta strand protein